MRASTALVAFALALGACTHSRTASDTAALHHRIDGRRVVVVLADGRRATAEGFRAEPDSVSWVDPATRSLRQTARTDVSGVLLPPRRGWGALEGLGVGLGAGVLGGAAVGYATYDGRSGTWCILACSRGESAAWLGSVSGLAGGAVGTAIGAARGNRLLYRLDTPREEVP